MDLEIIYATTSGNAETVANKLFEKSVEFGFRPNLGQMNDYTFSDFSKLPNVAIITATWGEGDVPDMGLDFWEELKNTNTKLVNQRYGLIALGDRSHENFCGAGKKISKKLDELGSKKVIEKLECDGDTEGTEDWSNKFLNIMKKQIYG